jgi:hypothetical protein
MNLERGPNNERNLPAMISPPCSFFRLIAYKLIGYVAYVEHKYKHFDGSTHNQRDNKKG